jgi:hypothetical protein
MPTERLASFAISIVVVARRCRCCALQDGWDSVDLERVRSACDPAASADLAVLLITVRWSRTPHSQRSAWVFLCARRVSRALCRPAFVEL